MPVWRLGYFEAPCDFPPRHLYAWTHRFDDQRREYRTIYCADERRTCLREVLADLRPNRKALSEYETLFGSGGPELESVGAVLMEWRSKHVLAEAEIDIQKGAIVDIEDPAVLKELERRLAPLLRGEGIRQLNIEELRGRNRHVTRQISRAIYDDDEAGIRFRSHLDTKACCALFEFRARLRQIGRSILLTDPVPELVAVCREFGLRLA